MLDECPTNTGTPSAREKVLNLVWDLFRSSHPNLFVCITSRPEQDINATLNSLMTPSHHVSLHEEDGQRQDINNYVSTFVQTDVVMWRWRAEDKELVVNTLSERANCMWDFSFTLLFMILVHGVGQVSVGVLPARHPTPMHAIEHSESPGRAADHPGWHV